LYVPPLPAENTVRSTFKLKTEASLIKMLNEFLARISRVAYLLYSLPLHEFLTSSLITPAAASPSIYSLLSAIEPFYVLQGSLTESESYQFKKQFCYFCQLLEQTRAKLKRLLGLVN
jgi:hypothetical protein